MRTSRAPFAVQVLRDTADEVARDHAAAPAEQIAVVALALRGLLDALLTQLDDGRITSAQLMELIDRSLEDELPAQRSAAHHISPLDHVVPESASK
ncbi:hypothetical protein [Nocardia altamirensis]|uniref:hypothetical protein n=1 Tax=Nocardia altamirensis TaxID=472158 RepID=UPI000840914B|nr:hypothetical protein [Nocardia altamirensis]